MSAPRYNKMTRELLRILRAEGWEMIGRGRGNHYQLRHPNATAKLVMPSTGGANTRDEVLTQARRLLR